LTTALLPLHLFLFVFSPLLFHPPLFIPDSILIFQAVLPAWLRFSAVHSPILTRQRLESSVQIPGPLEPYRASPPTIDVSCVPARLPPSRCCCTTCRHLIPSQPTPTPTLSHSAAHHHRAWRKQIRSLFGPIMMHTNRARRFFFVFKFSPRADAHRGTRIHITHKTT
jgi:hypothetical protein